MRHNAEEGVVVSGLSLAVRGVQRHHTGSYTCAATNTQGTNTSNPVHLLVQCELTCPAYLSTLYYYIQEYLAPACSPHAYRPTSLITISLAVQGVFLSFSSICIHYN